MPTKYLKSNIDDISDQALLLSSSQSQNNASVNIFVIHGKSKVPVSVPKHGLGAWRLKKCLQLPPNISVYTKIVSLKDVTSGPPQEVKLEQNQYASTLTMLMPEAVKENHSYEIVFEDTREDAVQKLTRQERDEIEMNFHKIDEDGDGSITVEDIRKYYENLIAVKKENLLEKMKVISEKKPNEGERIKNLYKQSCQALDRLIDISVEAFMKLDMDSTKSIDCSEFLAHEARLLAARKLRGTWD